MQQAKRPAEGATLFSRREIGLAKPHCQQVHGILQKMSPVGNMEYRDKVHNLFLEPNKNAAGTKISYLGSMKKFYNFLISSEYYPPDPLRTTIDSADRSVQALAPEKTGRRTDVRVSDESTVADFTFLDRPHVN